MGLWKQITGWWSKDRTELSEEEATMTQAERDVTEEDFESRKDDLFVKDQFASGAGVAGVDFERDSEAPKH